MSWFLCKDKGSEEEVAKSSKYPNRKQEVTKKTRRHLFQADCATWGKKQNDFTQQSAVPAETVGSHPHCNLLHLFNIQHQQRILWSLRATIYEKSGLQDEPNTACWCLVFQFLFFLCGHFHAPFYIDLQTSLLFWTKYLKIWWYFGNFTLMLFPPFGCKKMPFILSKPL